MKPFEGEHEPCLRPWITFQASATSASVSGKKTIFPSVASSMKLNFKLEKDSTNIWTDQNTVTLNELPVTHPMTS